MSFDEYKKNIFSGLVFLLFLMCTAGAVAAPVSIVATVDMNELAIEDSLLLNISVEGTRQNPFLPDMPDFKIQSRGTSSKVSIVNGQMSSIVEYSYVLYPLRVGVFTLGPFSVKVNGKSLESNLIAVKVLKARKPESGKKDVFVEAEVDNDKPFLNEEIVYTFRFYRSVRVANARLTESPSFEGFMSEPLGKAREYQKVINGKSYIVTEIKHALFPARTGVLELSPSRLYCDVVIQKRRQRRGVFNDSFFSPVETRSKSLRTAPVTVMVSPLPIHGKPSGFNNLVGDFSISSSVSKKNLQVGQSLTLTIVLSGTGNIKNHQVVGFVDPDDFKIYDDKPVFEPVIINGKIGGKLTIKKAMVPLKKGELMIPPVSVPYFNPYKKVYMTTRTDPCTIKVLPSDEGENLNAVGLSGINGTKQEVKFIGKDILPVHTSLRVLSVVRIAPLSFLFIFLFLLPVAVFVVSVIVKKTRERNFLDTGLGRSRNAYKKFKGRLPAVKNALQGGENLFYSKASKVFKDFIGDKLNIAGNALTADELEKRLSSEGIPVKLMEEIKDVISSLESGQFGFRHYVTEERQYVYDSMLRIVKILNGKLKR